MTDALRLEHVTAGYGPTVVLEDVSLRLPHGGTLALLGRNGVGKTTLLATIMGHTRLHAGRVLADDTDLSAAPIHARALTGIGYVPQEREIFPSLTVEENLTVGLRPGRWTLERVYTFFPHLAARRANYGNQLSGGEQQMLAIGRALACNPHILLMDEPLEGLAPLIVEELLRAMEKLRGDEGLAIVLVEQHSHLALRFADAAIVLDRGRLVWEGASATLAGSPEILAGLMGVVERKR